MDRLGPAKTYTTIAERDADVSFQIQENINKWVLVKEIRRPVFGEFILENINPTIWLEIHIKKGDKFDLDVKEIFSISDFPAESGGVITLVTNTRYIIKGPIKKRRDDGM